MNEITIEAGKAEIQYWRDLWRYRELFCFLAWRDMLVRYKQTAVGISWAVIRPLLTMLVLTFAFGQIAGLTSPGAPYPVMVLCGLLPWQFFASAFAESGGSLVANAGMISKVYFPRLIIPASSLITSFVDFLISSVLLAVLMCYYQFLPSPRIFLLPIFLIMVLGAAFGAGLWVSALMVKFRDFRFIIPFIVQFGLYVSPVGFSSDTVPAEWHDLCAINPMFPIIEGFRWSVLGDPFEVSWTRVAIAAGIIFLTIVTGIKHFRSTERTFADVI